ncbi:MAG: hypothetical protein LUD48_05490, partial [Prevotella sp.]|nr:hypothetical protein [Prevotella sp.]
MTKRILWKKGMRLTEDIFIQSDKCMSETVSRALLLGSIGRMGLFPKLRPFRLSLDISKDIVEVVSIDCLGLTRDGSLIDVSYDTNYTNIFDTRVTIPGRGTEVRYLLCIVIKDEWRDTNNGLCEPKYEFQLLEENSPVPDNALPIARILYDEYRWCADEIYFVPPCLYVTSHEKYEGLSSSFLQILIELNRVLPEKFITEEKDALKIFWPTVQQLMITMDKEREQLTPMSLLANVQKFISSFVCACTIDEYITIGEPEQYYAYINTPYNY